MYEDKKKIDREITYTKQLIKEETNNDIRFLLYNYLCNLYDVRQAVTGKKNLFLSNKKIFGSNKDYDRYIDRTDRLYDRFYRQFIINKNKIGNYLDNILDCDEEIVTYENVEFSKKEFFELFYSFCESLDLKSYFENIINDENIINVSSNSNFLGYTIINPISLDSKIFIKDFQYDLDSLVLLAHEFGHYYDYMELYKNRDKADIINFNYKSVYGETVSMLFEKLLLDFMIKNNICVKESKNKYLELDCLSKEHMLRTDIYTVLDDEYIFKGNYINLSNEKMFELVSNYFFYSDYLKDFILNSRFYLFEDLSYCVGDIMSNFLIDGVEKNGFNDELYKKFLDERLKESSVDFFIENELSSDKYNEVYQKHLELVKK